MSTKPWKQFLLKIPNSIKFDLEKIKTDSFVVACIKRVRKTDIEQGLYFHIGIKIENNELVFEKSIVPSIKNGRFSYYNIEGKEIVRKDEPKVPKQWSITSPNYGDWSKGSHENNYERDVYRKDFLPPKLLVIEIECLGFDLQKDCYVIKFTIPEVLNKNTLDVNDQLLFNINLLQENVGNFGVIEENATRDDYLKTLYVNWEIFPPGEKEEILDRIISSFGKNLNENVKKVLTSRYSFLEKLKPNNYIRGTNGFRKYFGAQFDNNLVVFENIEYGNAVYVMYENWEKLSQLSRIDLMKNNQSGFERIIHTKTWKLRLGSLVRKNKTPAN